MTPEELRTLFEYDAWANERTCEACAILTPEQFTRDLKSSFASVRDTLVHTMGAQWIWLERFHGRSPSGLPAPEAYPDLPSVRSRWIEIRNDLLAYVAGLSESDLNHLLEYRNFKGEIFRDVPAPLLQHVANHSTYHRGQIATLLRQLGVKPAGTDFIAFRRMRMADDTHVS